MAEVNMADGGEERVRPPVPMSYPSNSKTGRSSLSNNDLPSEKKVEKVVTGNVIAKKKSLGKKMAETFTGDDVSSVGTYVILEVMVPAAKNLIRDVVSEGIERLLFGEVRGRKLGINKTPNYVSYDRYSGGNNAPKPAREMSRSSRSAHDFSEIVLESRGEVETVIDSLIDLIQTYGVVTLADLYELVGITGNFIDQKWGWTNLDDATATRVRNGSGYLLNIPRPKLLD